MYDIFTVSTFDQFPMPKVGTSTSPMGGIWVIQSLFSRYSYGPKISCKKKTQSKDFTKKLGDS